MANVDGSEAEVAYYAGEWDSAATLADRHIDNPERFHSITARNIRGRIALAHGDTATALADARANVVFGRTARNHEFVCPGLSLLALGQEADGDVPAALSTADEYLTAWHDAGGSTPPALGEVAVLLARADSSDRVAAAATLLDDDNRWKSPIVEIAEGRYAEAARQLHELRAGPLAADADLLAAVQCQAEGRAADAERHARSARAFAERTGASVYQRRADELLRLTETA